MDNPENWQINVREYRRVIKNGQSRELANKCQRIPKGNQKWTIQRTGNMGYARRKKKNNNNTIQINTNNVK